jgi:hypothetical protein
VVDVKRRVSVNVNVNVNVKQENVIESIKSIKSIKSINISCGVVILTNIISYILYIIDNKTMPTTQIKPFGVFNGSKTASQSIINTSLGCIGCAPQQPASTPSPTKGFGSGAMIRPM